MRPLSDGRPADGTWHEPNPGPSPHAGGVLLQVQEHSAGEGHPGPDATGLGGVDVGVEWLMGFRPL